MKIEAKKEREARVSGWRRGNNFSHMTVGEKGLLGAVSYFLDEKRTENSVSAITTFDK